jgi:hypothetical protein
VSDVVRRACSLFLAALVLVLVAGCGDEAGDDEPRLKRGEAEAILLQQGYSVEGASCIIENAAKQNVDLMAVYARDKVTTHELSVLASVQEFCLKQFPLVTTTTGDPAATTTPPTTG